MKKVILLIALSICSISTAVSQISLNNDTTQSPQYSDYFILPECFDSVDLCYYYMTNPQVVYSSMCAVMQNPMKALAQPYFIDSMIMVRGLAGYFQLIPNTGIYDSSTYKYYMRIGKDLNTPIDSVLYSGLPLYTNRHYYELFFDNPIIIKDTFYLSITAPTHDWTSPDASYNEGSLNMYFNRKTEDIGKPNNELCCSQLRIKYCNKYDIWVDFASDTTILNPNAYSQQTFNDWFNDCSPSLYLFPILDTIPVTYSQADASVITDTIDSIFTFTMEILGQGYPAMPYEIGFVVSTDSNYLNLENGSVYNFLYDTTNNYYSQVFNFTTFPCNTDLYMRSFVLTKIYTTYGDTLTHIDYGDINSFSYGCIETDTNNITTIYNDIPIKLYPNPTDKELTIETTIPIQKIEIVNSNGQTIYTNEPNKKEIKINTSKFVPGNYIAVITTSKGVFKRRFVVK